MSTTVSFKQALKETLADEPTYVRKLEASGRILDHQKIGKAARNWIKSTPEAKPYLDLTPLHPGSTRARDFRLPWEVMAALVKHLLPQEQFWYFPHYQRPTETTYNRYKREASERLEEVNRLTEVNATLEAELTRSEQRVERRDATIDSLTTRLSKATTKLNAAKDQNELLSQDLADAEDEIDQLTRELKHLKHKMRLLGYNSQSIKLKSTKVKIEESEDEDNSQNKFAELDRLKFEQESLLATELLAHQTRLKKERAAFDAQLSAELSAHQHRIRDERLAFDAELLQLRQQFLAQQEQAQIEFDINLKQSQLDAESKLEAARLQQESAISQEPQLIDVIEEIHPEPDQRKEQLEVEDQPPLESLNQSQPDLNQLNQLNINEETKSSVEKEVDTTETEWEVVSREEAADLPNN